MTSLMPPIGLLLGQVNFSDIFNKRRHTRLVRLKPPFRKSAYQNRVKFHDARYSRYVRHGTHSRTRYGPYIGGCIWRWRNCYCITSRALGGCDRYGIYYHHHKHGLVEEFVVGSVAPLWSGGIHLCCCYNSIFTKRIFRVRFAHFLQAYQRG